MKSKQILNNILQNKKRKKNYARKKIINIKYQLDLIDHFFIQFLYFFVSVVLKVHLNVKSLLTFQQEEVVSSSVSCAFLW